MRRRAGAVATWLWALLTGPKFARSLERYNRAASELDKAVREVLTG
jgi:hypothetical protein